MKIRSKAPLRLGLAGGGTDVGPYTEKYGGAVLNATINLYAHCTLDTSVEDNFLYLEAVDFRKNETISLEDAINIHNGDLILHRAVYKRVMKEFNNNKFIPLKIVTYCDVPPGSGLGSSSTMVVAIIEAFRMLFSLPLGEYDIAKLAYSIEREDCRLKGGKQDQYAAAFGGFNFIEFYRNNVIVNPLNIRGHIINELQENMILFYSGKSRDSDKIISAQMNAVSNSGKSLQALHDVKNLSYEIKESVLKNNISDLKTLVKNSWTAKKNTSDSISNKNIEDIEKTVYDAGAEAFKVSGAGGGGFMIIFCAAESKFDIIRSLQKCDGQTFNFEFTKEGCISWMI